MKIYDYIIVGGGLLGNYTLNTLNTENFLFIDDNQQLNSHTFSSITDIIKYNKFPNIEWLFFSKIFFTKSLTNKVITPQIKSQIKSQKSKILKYSDGGPAITVFANDGVYFCRKLIFCNLDDDEFCQKIYEYSVMISVKNIPDKSFYYENDIFITVEDDTWIRVNFGYEFGKNEDLEYAKNYIMNHESIKKLEIKEIGKIWYGYHNVTYDGLPYFKTLSRNVYSINGTGIIDNHITKEFFKCFKDFIQTGEITDCFIDPTEYRLINKKRIVFVVLFIILFVLTYMMVWKDNDFLKLIPNIFF